MDGSYVYSYVYENLSFQQIAVIVLKIDIVLIILNVFMGRKLI